MRYSICILIPYFGAMPVHFPFWLKSCTANDTIDFIVFTDREMHDLPKNVRIIKMSLLDLKQLADQRLGINTSLNYPYKCCDFKVVYGKIFAKYLIGYDFWGHCDMDMVFGNLRAFLTDDVLERYDKIYDLGHLSLYRNERACNNRYQLSGSEAGDFFDVFSHDRIYGFDEREGICKIYKQHKFPMYDKHDYADISCMNKRFRLATMKGIPESKNYEHQAFYWEQGKAYRAYERCGDVELETFSYIHYKKRNFGIPEFDVKSASGFFITSGGYINKSSIGAPSLEEIKRTNPYPGRLHEAIERRVYTTRTNYSRLKVNMNKQDILRIVKKRFEKAKTKA